MSEDLLSRSGLLDRLRQVPCPYKLYPARLRALEVMTGKQHLARVDETITFQLGTVAGPGWKHQFQRDLKTYGLLEAIGYFHTYDLSRAAKGFVTKACELYDELAALYMEHHQEILESDDPRIQAQLALLREYGDSSEHTMPGLTFPPFERPPTIPDPEAPPIEPDYERQLPINETALWLGLEEGTPGNLVGELVGYYSSTFTFDGFPGIQSAFRDVADTLVKFDIDPFSSEGQFVLDALCTLLTEFEAFGDYDRWLYCGQCGCQLMVEGTLDAVNDYLAAGGWFCPSCREQPTERPQAG